jgi:type I restriction enzyme R subunit
MAGGDQYRIHSASGKEVPQLPQRRQRDIDYHLEGRGPSPELRSKKALIESFIAGINDVEDVFLEWRDFVMRQKEQELTAIITEERLKPEETRQSIETALQAGEIKTTGTDIDRLMPPVSHFGGGNRTAKKQGIIDRLKTFFDKSFGIV